MLNFTRSLKLLAVIFTIALLFSGCSDPEKKKVAHYNKGMEYVEKEEWKTAIAELKNAVLIDPKYADARYQLGLAYIKDNQPKNAFREMLRATSLNPENLDAQLMLGTFMAF